MCRKCRHSAAHYLRELRRGGVYPKKLKPCGTNAAAARHRRKKEPLCFACQLASANDRAERRKEKSKIA